MVKVTLELLKDLRKSEGVVFRVNYDSTYQLELFKKLKGRDVKGEWRVVHTFEDSSQWNKIPESLFVSLYKDISGWDALIKLIKKDDELSFRVFANNSQLLEKKGLTNDQLHVTVYRNNKEYLHDLLLEYEINRPEYRAIKSR